MSRKITRNEIATHCGVAPSTVTRALNNHPAISAETVKKVREAARKLGYIPSSLGKKFSRKRSYQLGFFTPYDPVRKYSPLANHYFNTLLYGMLQTALKERYSIQVIADYEISAEKIEEMVSSHQIDGVIFPIRPVTEDRFDYLHEKNIPFVLIHNYVPGKPYLSVVCDPEPGMRQMFDFLIEKGVKTLGYLGGGAKTREAIDRTEMLNRLSREYGIEVVCRREGNFFMKSGFAAAEGFAENGSLPEVIFCANDTMALGLVQGLQRRGIHVPEDVGVIGFDNTEYSSIMSPKLSTVNNPFYDIGSSAAKILINKIRRKPIASVVFGSEFILRESVK